MTYRDTQERAYEAEQHRAYYAQQDRDEARAEAIEERAADLFAELAITPAGDICPKAMDEAIGDLCCQPRVIAELAQLKKAGRTEAIGQRVSEWFDTYWERRCRELAEDQIDAEAELARAEHEADRWLAREAG